MSNYGFPPNLKASAVAGQKKIAVTGTAVRMPTNALLNGAVITNNSSTNDVFLGDSSVNNTSNGDGNGYVLKAGASIGFAYPDVNTLYLNGTANDWVSFLGS